MKKFTFLLLLSLSFYYLPSFCQDILVLKNGEEVKVKVSEVLPDRIKYKKWDNQDGPLYSEPKENVFMIKYQNGSKDVFTNNATPVTNNENIGDKYIGVWLAFNRTAQDRVITIKKDGNLYILMGNELGKVTFNYSNGILKGSDLMGDLTYGESSGHIYFFGGEYYKATTTISSNNNSQNQTVQASTSVRVGLPSEIIKIKPIFEGAVVSGSDSSYLKIVLNSFEDGIGKGNEIRSGYTQFIPTIKKIRPTQSVSTESLQRNKSYVLECNTVTFYESKISSGKTYYSASLRLEFTLWEVGKDGYAVKSIGIPNKVLKTTDAFLGGWYTSQSAALDALGPRIPVPVYDILNSFFPVKTAVTEIVDSNKKGIPKAVKISAGSFDGLYKGCRLIIDDPSRKAEDFDLYVDEVFDKYSICKVKNNESIISDRIQQGTKLVVLTLNPIVK